ncbi:YgaP family membrane protein [Natrinema longum]|uniref:DUF2892 domain-containing protein n=1 Tax=Natrinema longum TaxID=370324 RepID=A0A8A2U7A8_9EURY|nr:DUF2892 domain-containing protein [Natrinema longum]MBZ6494873.1 DUF2892 domain-containing protein [Natrinema longum]QSW83828.1 DUF2892 domain-containing protein [Natrinema longum]
MQKNDGGIDRLGRLVVGIVAVLAGVAALTGYPVGLVIGGIAFLTGVVFLVIGTTQKCPVNEATGIDTTD